MNLTNILLIIVFITLFILVLLVIKLLLKMTKPTKDNSLLEQIDSRFTNASIQNNNKIDSLTRDLDNKNNLSDQKIKVLIDELNNSLEKQNKENNIHIKEVIEKVTKLDSVNQHMLLLSDNIDELQSTLSDKKSRGTFGEMQLYQLFHSVYGENNDKVFKTQYTLSNSTMVDLIFFAPEPLGSICIDSKFPLENFKSMIDKNNNEDDIKAASKLFKADIKKHIKDIKEKYIIENETSEQAIMFVPSEAIFAEIYANHNELIELSYKEKVLICSPTTLMSVLTLTQTILLDMKRNENAKSILNNLNDLSKEFILYNTRWENLKKDINKVYEDTNQITITTDKIIKKFDNIDQDKGE
ncbi:MAG: DNA recombination protein RmuC [Mycoplasmatales bacterium]